LNILTAEYPLERDVMGDCLAGHRAAEHPVPDEMVEQAVALRHLGVQRESDQQGGDRRKRALHHGEDSMALERHGDGPGRNPRTSRWDPVSFPQLDFTTPERALLRPGVVSDSMSMR
jgi:hypothetical protein